MYSEEISFNKVYIQDNINFYNSHITLNNDYYDIIKINGANLFSYDGSLNINNTKNDNNIILI